MLSTPGTDKAEAAAQKHGKINHTAKHRNHKLQGPTTEGHDAVLPEGTVPSVCVQGSLIHALG